MNDDLPDHILDYVAASLEAADLSTERPPSAELSHDELHQANALIDELLSGPHLPVDIDLPPLNEDPLAIKLGIAAEAPAAIVDADAVAAALEGRDLHALAAELSHFGHTADAGWLQDLATGVITQVRPQALRTLSILVDLVPGDLALSAIAPFPENDRPALEAYLADTEWVTESQDDHIAIANPDLRLGVLVAHVPEVEGLTALNARRTAWEHLTGRWAHLNGCAVVSPVDDWAAVVVDAIDCQPHQRAPTGVLTYGPEPDIEPLRDALSSYAGRLRIRWEPPTPAAGFVLGDAGITADAADGIKDLLTNSRFGEPKRRVWADVCGVLEGKPLDVFEPFTDLDEDIAHERIEVMLDALSSP